MDNPNEKRKIRNQEGISSYKCVYIYIYTFAHTYVHTYTRTYVHTYADVARKSLLFILRSGMCKGGKCSLFSDFRRGLSQISKG